ncbi:MAG TPA: tetratricopeptide repeat protein [Gammaproteobacteria bacterium]|nr:tetratricopeptide repeat protein [Gammaproteobacteria bacterium]
MRRTLVIGVVLCIAAQSSIAEAGDRKIPNENKDYADNRSVLGEQLKLLSAGAEAIRSGRYDDGIRLTTLGLERDGPNPFEKAAALANLCAAHAAIGQLDTAIRYCSDSLSLNDSNWRAYSNRSYAYYLKGQYSEARSDIDAAAALAPSAPQVLQIRGMLNEMSLRPRIIMEEHR